MPNEIWQADHTPLDIFVLDSNKQPVKPCLTAVVDDYSRAVPGYYLGTIPPSSIRIALALRQAIWRKEEKNWTICGIPEKLYSDRGSDFMSNHIDQVAISLKFETIQTEPGDPQGKGKCERFFKTVNSTAPILSARILTSQLRRKGASCTYKRATRSKVQIMACEGVPLAQA